MNIGIDRVLLEPAWGKLVRGRRTALVCHAASITSSGLYTFDILCSSPETRPKLLFTPEHGLFGEQAYMEPVQSGIEPVLGLPVVSLYGDRVESIKPEASALSGLDAVIFDLQDVGARYYTYLATMCLVLEACADAGVQVVVLDRPNPIGLSNVEGNRVLPPFRSFVGYADLANRHGMTAGEVATFYVATSGLPVDLVVVPCAGLGRAHKWPDTGIPFVPPSPNIPTWETALVYPGMCLLEGTNLSEGRGTTTPFFLAGAPFVQNPWDVACKLEEYRLPGVRFRPTFFSPRLDKWAGKRCGGVHLMVTDTEAFSPLLTGIAVLCAFQSCYRGLFEWRKEPYEFDKEHMAIDLLLGDPVLRKAIEAGARPDEVIAAMEPARKEFVRSRERFLIYR